MKIIGEALILGAGTVTAKLARSTRRTPVLSLSDEQRMMTLLAIRVRAGARLPARTGEAFVLRVAWAMLLMPR
jgi:hypothetical protein